MINDKEVMVYLQPSNKCLKYVLIINLDASIFEQIFVTE